MKESVRLRWEEALRSGNYNQTQETLGQVDPETKAESFCCLGVLCEIAAQDGVVDKSVDEEGKIYYLPPDNSENPEYSVLPGVVAEWAGVWNSNPDVVVEGDEISLAHVNDKLEYNFDQIADLIAEQL